MHHGLFLLHFGFYVLNIFVRIFGLYFDQCHRTHTQIHTNTVKKGNNFGVKKLWRRWDDGLLTWAYIWLFNYGWANFLLYRSIFLSYKYINIFFNLFPPFEFNGMDIFGHANTFIQCANSLATNKDEILKDQYSKPGTTLRELHSMCLINIYGNQWKKNGWRDK